MNQTNAFLYERTGDYFHYAKVQAAIENALLDTEEGVLSAEGSRLVLEIKKLPNVDTGMPTKQAMRFNPDGPEVYDYFDRTGDTMILFGLTLSAVSIMQLLIAEKRSYRVG